MCNKHDWKRRKDTVRLKTRAIEGFEGVMGFSQRRRANGFLVGNRHDTRRGTLIDNGSTNFFVGDNHLDLECELRG
jgi:hypothetical protein